MKTPPDKSPPHALLRGVLALWLFIWAVIIVLFIINQVSSAPLFNWTFGLVWLGVSIIGWVMGYASLKRLRAMPPE